MSMGPLHLRRARPGTVLRRIGRGLVGALACAGGAAAAVVALQFTQIPWKAYSILSRDGGVDAASAGEWVPSHILVLGGSGVPGESSLVRLWHAAEAAGKHPGAPVWMAVPCSGGADGNPAAEAYAAELRLRGVVPERCAARACGNNTREQAVALVRDLAEGGDGAARILLVTSPEHVRRACLAVRRAAREAGADVEVRGLAAATLSLEDHGGEPTPPPPAPDSTAGEASGTPSSGMPAAIRYDFWNHARYSLDAARECTALLYYRARGWI